MHFLGTSALVRPLPPTSPKCGSETFQVRTLLGCVKVGVYKPLDVLSLTQSNNLNGSIAISNEPRHQPLLGRLNHHWRSRTNCGGERRNH